jgi:hypothetical protein
VARSPQRFSGFVGLNLMRSCSISEYLNKTLPSFKYGLIRVLALVTLINIAAIIADIGIVEPKNEPSTTEADKPRKIEKAGIWVKIWESSARLCTIFIAAFNGLLVFVTYRLVTSTDKLWRSGEQQIEAATRSANSA